MKQVKEYILEDLEKLNNAGLTKVYKFIRRDIIANIPKQGSDIPVNSSGLLCAWHRIISDKCRDKGDLKLLLPLAQELQEKLFDAMQGYLKKHGTKIHIKMLIERT